MFKDNSVFVGVVQLQDVIPSMDPDALLFYKANMDLWTEYVLSYIYMNSICICLLKFSKILDRAF